MFSGDTIGKYRLVRRLGRGGMGEVWLATASGHGGFKKNVVVKTLLPELACDPLFIDMLAHEARICAKLSHPNLIEVFDFIEHGGIYLLAMEHVDGRPLNHVMKAAHARGWEVPAWFALRVAWDCCRGLECAHDEGIIHCDLSPSNVMIAYTGVTKILDFGVAHSSARGPKTDRLKGKFPYMSPERIKSRETDRRTDIYALGVMLYLLFTGELPFTADSDAALLHKIIHDRPRPPSELCEIDPRVEQLILRAMQPDPAARHQTIGEVLAALSPCLDGLLGAYGQQEVAAFSKALFEPEPSVKQRRAARQATTEALPLIPAPNPLDSEVAELESHDLEVESSSSVLEVPRITATAAAIAAAAGTPAGSAARAPAPSAPSTAGAAATATVPLQPPRIATPSRSRAFLPAPDSGSLHRPVTAVFMTSSVVHETRTSVQSLFGDAPSPARRRQYTVTAIFDRPTLDHPGEPASGAVTAGTAWPWPVSRSKP